MTTSAILHNNLADDGDVSASSWIAVAPPATLQNAHVTRRWKGSNGSSEYILCVWGSAQLIDAVALLGCAVIDSSEERTMSEAATYRLRVSSVDETGVAGDLYDSGVVAGAIREAYGSLVVLLPSSVSAIAVRIDLSESGVSAVMAGRLVVGLLSQFTINFSYGWSLGYADLSRRNKSVGGLTFVDRQDKFRVLTAVYEALDPVDRAGHVDDVDRLNGLSDDVLFVTDVESAQLDRDSIWGLIQDMSPPVQPTSRYWSKKYSIEERR